MTTAAGWWNAPDEVLALGQVDAGLAADRRVDLGDERRRDVDDRHAAQVRRGEEPGRVAERAAADRDERLAALDAQPRRARARPSSTTARRLASSPCGQQDPLDRPAAAPRRPSASRSPTAAHAPGLGDEDRAPRLEPLERVVDRVARRCRRRARTGRSASSAREQRRVPRQTRRRQRGEPLVDGVDDRRGPRRRR